MYGLVQIFIRLPLGIASDVFGKRKAFIIIGLFALGIGPIILATSNSASGLFIGRAITGFAAGTWVPLSAHIIDKSTSDIFKTTNVLSFIGNLASILAVVLSPFLMLTKNLGLTLDLEQGFLSSMIAIGIWVYSTSNQPESKVSRFNQPIGSEIKNPFVLFPGAMFAIIQFGIHTSTFTFIPLLGNNLQIPDIQFNALLISYFIISIITNILIKKVLNNLNGMDI